MTTKVDIYNHFMPKVYLDKMMELNPNYEDLGKRVRNIPMLADLDARFKAMDEFGDYCQVISVPAPPPEVLAGPDRSPELAQAANDGMAELCAKHPDRFPGFTATLAMNNIEAAVAEVHRAINDLGACGVEICTNAKGKPMDLPEFEPVYEAIAGHDLPLWVHPVRPATFPDYMTEEKSKYEIWWTFGWPYETSAFMARLVFSGIMDRYPNLKVITHHMGGMVPYFEGRVGPGWDQLGSRTSDEDYGNILKQLKKPHLEYFKDFYADTAVFGSRPATVCGIEFFGVEKILFASDSPFDPEGGPQYIRDTIKVLDSLDISDDDRHAIYQGNAEKLLKRSFGS